MAQRSSKVLQGTEADASVLHTLGKYALGIATTAGFHRFNTHISVQCNSQARTCVDVVDASILVLDKHLSRSRLGYGQSDYLQRTQR